MEMDELEKILGRIADISQQLAAVAVDLAGYCEKKGETIKGRGLDPNSEVLDPDPTNSDLHTTVSDLASNGSNPTLPLPIADPLFTTRPESIESVRERRLRDREVRLLAREQRLGAKATGKRPAKARGQLPDDFTLTPADRELAKLKGMSDPHGIDHQFETFCSYHHAKGNTMKDWHGAWRTWCLNYHSRNQSDDRTAPLPPHWSQRK